MKIFKIINNNKDRSNNFKSINKLPMNLDNMTNQTNKVKLITKITKSINKKKISFIYISNNHNGS